MSNNAVNIAKILQRNKYCITYNVTDEYVGVNFPAQKLFLPYHDEVLITYVFDKQGLQIVDDNWEVRHELECSNCIKRLLVILDILRKSLENSPGIAVFVNSDNQIQTAEQVFSDMPKIHGGRIVNKEKRLYELICQATSDEIRTELMEKDGFGDLYIELKEHLSNIY